MLVASEYRGRMPRYSLSRYIQRLAIFRRWFRPLKVCCYTIISKRRVMVPQNAANPTVNATVSTSGDPKVVLRLF
jgi:hypothetical protein